MDPVTKAKKVFGSYLQHAHQTVNRLTPYEISRSRRRVQGSFTGRAPRRRTSSYANPFPTRRPTNPYRRKYPKRYRYGSASRPRARAPRKPRVNSDIVGRQTDELKRYLQKDLQDRYSQQQRGY